MTKAKWVCNLLVLVAGSCVTRPQPVMPPLYDNMIVFGQRVGPVSLGMSEAQLVRAVGEPTSNVDYQGFQPGGPSRRGLVYATLGLSLVLEDGSVIRISPTDNRYSTVSGIRVGAQLPANAEAGASKHERSGVTSYCFDGTAAITVRSSVDAHTAPDCAVGAVCDIVVGGCVP